MRLFLYLIVVAVLCGCADPTRMLLVSEAGTVGDHQKVVVVTNRARDAAGNYGGGRAAAFTYLDVGVSIPRDRRPGTVPVSYSNPVPGRHFVLTSSDEIGGKAAFLSTLRRSLAELAPAERDITIFVHGYNTSFSDGVFRTAQLAHDFGLKGVAVGFSWPSAAHPLGYSHDRDSVLLARDGLEEMLRDVSRAGARNVVIVGHSLGAMLVMESLRQMAIASPGLPDRILDGVVLIAPDIDTDLFHAQAGRIRFLPQPFAIFVSQKDRALMLSSRINGRSNRLGTLDSADSLSDLDVTIVDVTAFSGPAAQSHMTAVSSPALIALLSRSRELSTSFARAGQDARGGLPGVAVTVSKATQLILSPGLLRN